MKKIMRTIMTAGLLMVAADSFAGNLGTEPSGGVITEDSCQTARVSKTHAVTHTDVVQAHSSDRYSCVLQGAVEYHVFLSGDGDTDLDLYIYDEDGRLIYDENESVCHAEGDCTITPRWTGRYTIKVVNRGAVYNRYTIRII